ncbi:MAG: TonB-dependent receptor plug domain-containing protein [Geobacter sp.]|nr:TonB-dependent receptor plug domain-containing protein [Geobacter sp.]
MTLIKPLHSLRAFLITLCLGLCIIPGLAWGDDLDSADSLNLFNAFDEKQATTYSIPRPVSKIAENISVITADDIERLNAHTLAEVLQTVPGLQLDQLHTPGNTSFFTIHGNTNRHILVQIDGIPQNFISSDNAADPGSIPVQMIERVEIIKGGASAAWGSGLGGVVNIVTKAPDSERKAGGMLSGSIGSRYTADTRAELSGTLGRFGYYLTGGNMSSDGLTPGTQVRFNHGFGKLTYDLPSKGKITLGLDLRDKSIGLEDSIPYDFHDTSDSRYASGYLAFRYPLTERLTLDLNGYGGRRLQTAKWGALTSPDLFLDSSNREIYQGGKLGLTWGDADTGVTAGLEYEHHDLRGREAVYQEPASNYDLALDRWSGHLNGIWSIGRLSLLPGLRFDHTNLLDDAYSYTLGATFRLSDSTTLRGYAARGYSMPLVNNLAIMNGQRRNQNIQTVQAGIETTAIPYLWLKGTLFYNNIWKIQSFDTSVSPATVTLRDQVRQGAELELRTSPVYGLSLTGGYTFSDSWDKATKVELDSGESGPRQNVKLGLNYYNSEIGLRGVLTGNYVWWKSPDYNNANLSAMIWDMHLNWKPFPKKELAPELFFSIHNIFNGDQYIVDFRPNAPRWFEGGVRVKF